MEVEGTIFDEASRFTARTFNPYAFLAWIRPKVVAAYQRMPDWLDTRQAKLTCDLVAGWTRLKDGQPLATVIEFLTRPRLEYLGKVARYVLEV